MPEFRFKRPCREEFAPGVYRPGVMSLSRLLWGSLGGGLVLALLMALSGAFQVGVLAPPLAASCFIAAACPYLRVARPKAVIVGHFVSAVGGLAAVRAGDWLLAGTAWAVPGKLGLAVLLAAALMQLLDADHPPAAATAAIPAILPLPAPDWALPLHMAWGGVVVVVLAALWNRVWFECPTPDESGCRTWLGLGMDKPDIAGSGACVLAAALMAARPLSETAYQAGLGLMLAGLLILSLHHFTCARTGRESGAGPCPGSGPLSPSGQGPRAQR
jgi:hypothetical protein